MVLLYDDYFIHLTIIQDNDARDENKFITRTWGFGWSVNDVGLTFLCASKTMCFHGL